MLTKATVSQESKLKKIDILKKIL